MPALIEVLDGDVLCTPCDVLILKFSQTFRGADLAVAQALDLDQSDFTLGPREYRLLPTGGKLACRHVLFYGVEGLANFRYEEIRTFSARTLETLARMDIPQDTLATTMHGANYGLDERESFSAQTAGLLDFLTNAARPPGRIAIVEQNPARCQRMRTVLQRILAESGFGQMVPPANGASHPATPVRLPDAGIRSDAKRHVFVAMPYTEEMDDVYEFGIKEPVNEANYLCERCDQDAFTGDILHRLKGRITTADVVIADLTGSNPNVYLEVGYAWGKSVPTLLIAKQGEELKFDVKTQKCIFTKRFPTCASSSWIIC